MDFTSPRLVADWEKLECPPFVRVSAGMRRYAMAGALLWSRASDGRREAMGAVLKVG